MADELTVDLSTIERPEMEISDGNSDLQASGEPEPEEEADAEAEAPERQGTGASEFAATSSTLLLHTLPHELLLRILAFLDVPDLLAVSRTNPDLRPLSLDPVLHRQRLASIPSLLSYYLDRRPPLSTLKPPHSNIYLTTTACAARRVSRELISSRLRRRLTRRPEVADLVSRNVLPGECCAFLFHSSRTAERSLSRGRGNRTPEEPRDVMMSEAQSSIQPRGENTVVQRSFESPRSPTRSPGYLSPSLIHAKRLIERERVKDRIRRWIENRGCQELERRLRAEEEESKHSVAGLIRRFVARGKEGEQQTTEDGGRLLSRSAQGSFDIGNGSRKKPVNERWGRGAVNWAERRKRDPTRAHVHGLRRFWEGVGKADR